MDNQDHHVNALISGYESDEGVEIISSQEINAIKHSPKESRALDEHVALEESFSEYLLLYYFITVI